MEKQILIIKKSQIALVYTRGQIVNLIMESDVYRVGDIYAGKIDKLLASLEAAFINLHKREKNGFLPLEDLQRGSIARYKDVLKSKNKKKIY